MFIRKKLNSALKCPLKFTWTKQGRPPAAKTHEPVELTVQILNRRQRIEAHRSIRTTHIA